MHKLYFTLLLTVFFVSSFFTSLNSAEDFVYLCNKPGQKCYYLFPCQELRETCNSVNGKLFKVPLSRAIQMKREKCDCEIDNPVPPNK